MRSLNAQNHDLSDPLVQLEKLDASREELMDFGEVMAEAGLFPLTATGIEVLQVNVGKMCNQTCTHCHVDAGPDRKEIMTKQTMTRCLEALRQSSIQTVDLTGGAPEMNPHFRWFVEEITELGRKVIVRSNLTILTVNEKYRQLPQFFADRKVTVISSLPCYTASNTDKQRGEGVFARSLEALRMLNRIGYGLETTGLELHLVYNPLDAVLPSPQGKLESDYKRTLGLEYGIVFNHLYCITNLPVNRFLDYLLQTGQYEQYMQTLISAFNPAAACGVMCRNTLSVGWDGQLYDCDFNQMLELAVDDGSPRHIRDFEQNRLESRAVVTGQHCFGCTAGAGSSCRGEIAE